jgi:hypothetical protein
MEFPAMQREKFDVLEDVEEAPVVASVVFVLEASIQQHLETASNWRRKMVLDNVRVAFVSASAIEDLPIRNLRVDDQARITAEFELFNELK